MKKIKLAIIILLVLILAGIVMLWLNYSDHHPSTSDAYVEANIIHLSPQIAGKVAEVMVHSYQQVRKGDVLLQIDQRNYKLAVERAQANLQLVQAQMYSAKEQTRASQAKVVASEQQQANVNLNNRRTETLVKKGVISKELADNSTFKLKEATANTLATSASMASTQALVNEAEAQIAAANIALAQARLNFSYTTISAPADGFIGDTSVRPGDFVTTGQPLFTLVDDSLYWISANYKETDLERIRPGQTASISFDMYPQLNFTGRVEAVSPASGTAFSLIPPQNATGNWVKVTQRFPVRIAITRQAGDIAEGMPLRVGASATVTINTTTDSPPSGKIKH